ncbi:MAG: TlpA family protein disulfide reductase [Epsilonproteobacteria bacterium]|nr:TlpA family protein disulfide reductase [Campylobacterota bacterium]
MIYLSYPNRVWVNQKGVNMYKEIFMISDVTSSVRLKQHLLNSAGIMLISIILLTGKISITQAAQAAPNAVFTVNLKTYSLDRFRGRKVMLWLFSTWCPSCQVGLRVLSDNRLRLKKYGLQVIALVNYKNGGYSGPTAQEFAEKYGKSVVKASNWLFGNASKRLAAIYNSKGYPDIYFLIDKKGFIRIISDAPAATIDRIINFAKSKKSVK